jgi:hypothetical protein
VGVAVVRKSEVNILPRRIHHIDRSNFMLPVEEERFRHVPCTIHRDR